MSESSIERRALVWALGRDAGASSMAIMSFMLGLDEDRTYSYPHDGGDLGRCLRLLDRIPEWKPRMVEMRKVSPQWAALVDHWDELVAKYAAKHPRLYERMQAILRPIEEKDENIVFLGEGISIVRGR